MVEQQPTFRRFNRRRAGADFGALPAAFRPHHKTVLAPVNHIFALAEVNIAKRGVAVITRAVEQDIFPVDSTRKEHAIAVVRQQGVFQEVKFLKIEGVPNTNRGAMVTVAPGNVETIFQPGHARVITIIGKGAFGILANPPDRLMVNLPMDSVLAEATVNVHMATLVIAAENASERAVERHNRAVENAI